MNENDKTIVVGGPLSTAVVQGSKIYKCTKCDTEVAISPVGQKTMKEENGMPYCMRCALEFIKSSDQPPEFLDHTEALKLAIEHIESHEKN